MSVIGLDGILSVMDWKRMTRWHVEVDDDDET